MTHSNWKKCWWACRAKCMVIRLEVEPDSFTPEGAFYEACSFNFLWPGQDIFATDTEARVVLDSWIVEELQKSNQRISELQARRMFLWKGIETGHIDQDKRKKPRRQPQNLVLVALTHDDLALLREGHSILYLDSPAYPRAEEVLLTCEETFPGIAQMMDRVFNEGRIVDDKDELLRVWSEGA